MIKMKRNARRRLHRKVFGQCGRGEDSLEVAPQLLGAFGIEIQVTEALVIPEYNIKCWRLRPPSHLALLVESGKGVRVVGEVHDEVMNGTVPAEVEVVVVPPSLVLYIVSRHRLL